MTTTVPVTSILESPQPQLEHDLPKLTPTQLRIEQLRTLDTPRRRYSIAARVLFLGMDLLYGRKRTLKKFRVLEIVARVPYQSWETATYKKITKRHNHPLDVRRLWERVKEFRAQQDNEQWHLLILDELVRRQSEPRRWRTLFWHGFVPRVIAIGYWHFSWLLYVLKPTWSHRLNADFEDHAEHEYAVLVAEHPEWDDIPYFSLVAEEYGSFACLADLFRQIGHDERMHKQESEAWL